jgi:hypothetical protein
MNVRKTLLRPHKSIVDEEDLPGRLIKNLALPALKSPTPEREQGRLIGRLHKKKRVVENIISTLNITNCRSRWPCSLRRMSAAARLLRSGVRIPTEAWTFVYCGCCMLSGRSLSTELITRSEESYCL